MNDVIKHKIKHNAHRALVSVKWVIFAILVGGIVGLCGTAFYFCLTFVTVLRGQNPWLLYLLPVGGLIIVGAYHLLHDEKDTGTNLVISAIHSDDELEHAAVGQGAPGGFGHGEGTAADEPG